MKNNKKNTFKKRLQQFNIIAFTFLGLILLLVFMSGEEKSSTIDTPSFGQECFQKMGTGSELICNNMSSWDGSYSPLKQHIKNNLKNPSSFKHVSTTFDASNSKYILFIMEYKGTNSFNAVITEYTTVKVDRKTLDMEIVK